MNKLDRLSLAHLYSLTWACTKINFFTVVIVAVSSQARVFATAIILHLILIFAGKDRAYQSESTQAMPANIMHTLPCMKMTNILSYYYTETFTAVKRFIVQAPVWPKMCYKTY